MSDPATSKFKFLASLLSKLPRPERGRLHCYDTGSPGLELIKTKNGTATFYTLRWMKEKKGPVRVRIGRFPQVSISEARKLNAENLHLISRGIDPNAAKQAAEITLGGLWELLLRGFYKSKKSVSTWQDYSLTFNKHLKGLSTRPLLEISTAEVQNLHAKIGQECGRHAANNMLRLLHAIFNKANEHGFKGQNPCRGVELFKTQARSRIPQGDEVPRLIQAVKDEPNSTARDILLLLIYSGQRKSDVCAMQWSAIDLERKEWRLQRRNAQDAQRVFLIPEAVQLLQHRLRDDSPWVFPGEHGAAGHFQNLKKAWARVLARSAITNLRIQDLRRFHATMLIRSGAALSVVQKALGHKSYQSVRIYARLNPDPVRSAVMAATQAIFKAADTKAAGRVVGSIKPHTGPAE